MGIKAQFMAQIDGINAKKDHTLSVKLGTQEMSADETSYLFDLMGKAIWVAIAETEHETIEVPEILPEFKGDRSPGQIYRIWETTKKDEPFPRFYDSKMAQITEWLKEKYLQ
jgi:hypothetical protein